MSTPHATNRIRPQRRALIPLLVTWALLVACAGEAPAPVPPDRTVATVRVLPAAISLDPGEEISLVATPRNARGDALLDKTAAWSTDDARVATIAPTGRVRAVAEGSALITARVDGKEGSAVVAVRAPRVARILLSTASLALSATEEHVIVATPLAADETVLRDRLVTWESDDPAVARVAPDGWVLALKPGRAILTARSEGRSASATVVVNEFTEFDLVFERVVGDRTELFRIDLNGGGARPLFAPGTPARDPAPAPDGSRVAFAVLDYYRIPGGAEGDLYIAKVDGTGLQRLTNATGFEHQPAWSPDGTKLVYRTQSGTAGGDIWVIDADGRNARNLTADPRHASSDERDPAWSADGSRLAFTSTVSGRTEIWTMASDGSDHRQVTFTTAFESRPAWSPDGKWLAFAQRRPGETTDLVVTSVTGEDYVRIELEGDQESPAWSPDSRMVAFSSSHEGARAIYALHLHSIEIVRRTPPDAADYHPAWLRRLRR